MVEYFTQPAAYEIRNLRLTEAPNEIEDGLVYDKWETRSTLSEDLTEAGDGW